MLCYEKTFHSELLLCWLQQPCLRENFTPVSKLFETEHETSSSVNVEQRHLLCRVSITNRL